MFFAFLFAALAPPATSNWVVTEAADSMTDAVEIHAAVEGAGGQLVYMCLRGQAPMIMFRPTRPLGVLPTRAERRPLMFRFDDAAPVTEAASYSNSDATATELGSVSRVVLGLMSARRVRVRAQGYPDVNVDAEFVVTGFRQAWTDVNARCLAH